MPKPAAGAQRASASQESLKDSLKESQNEAPEAWVGRLRPMLTLTSRRLATPPAILPR